MELVVDSTRPAVAIGECMLELSRTDSAGDSRFGAGWTLGLGGDTWNTAVHLQRLGLPVRYLTALGEDPFSADMLAAWQAEGLGTSLVLRHPRRLPGMYAIHTGADGERSFSYWRSQSAVRSLFELPGIEEAITTAGTTGLLYLSGITLSLFGPAERTRLTQLAADVRARGGVVAFDPNYRPAGWDDAATARAAILAMAPQVSIALPTLEDEQQLFGDASVASVIERWSGFGVREVIVKRGAAGSVVASGTSRVEVPAVAVDRVIDTTGAGDAFNAGYLVARSRGNEPPEAARAAAQLAARVIQHRGALLPKDGR